MSSSARQKLVIIGLDAFTPTILQRLAGEGALPTIARFMRQGCYARATPFFTCDTGVNWASIASGAPPAVHGCHFHLRLPGRPLDEPLLGFPSQYCQAEMLWQTASKLGLNSVVFDYPHSYPVNAERVIHVGEDGCPDNSVRELSGARGYVNRPLTGHEPEVLTQVEVRPATGWQNLPSNAKVSEVVLPLVPGPRSEKVTTGTLLGLLEKGPGGNQYEKISFFAHRDYGSKLGEARAGHWTDWMKCSLPTDQGPVEVAFRAKVFELTPDGSRIHILLTQTYPTSGFTHPASLSEELVAHCGPYHYQAHTQEWVFFGACDIETTLEEMEYHIQWYQKAAEYVLSKYDWDLFMMKWHDPDTFQHICWNMIDPVHPLYDPDTEAKGWDLFRRAYGLGDRLLNAIEQIVGDQAIIVVVSDHGQFANTYSPDFREALVASGLTTYSEDGSVDWTRTRAYFANDGVWVNLKGREPQGIVEPGEEYEQVREVAIQLLLDVKHPETGQHAFNLVCTKEDAAFMGVGGERAPDVVFALQPVDVERRYTAEEYEKMCSKGMWRFSRGTHGTQLPSTRFSLGGTEGIFMVRGPGFNEGVSRARPVSMGDIAPTLCHAWDVPAPADSQGAILHDLLVTER